MKTTVQALYPIYCSDKGVGHTCLSLCGAMREPGFDVQLTVPATEPCDRREYVRDAVPHWLRSVSCRQRLRNLRHRCTEWLFLYGVCLEAVAYLWPAVSMAVYETLNRRDHTIVAERINCHRATAVRILDEAYARLGWPATHGIRSEDVARETDKLSIADYVFCPSPFVRQSMIDAGIAPDKLLLASYGWEPRRFEGQHRWLPPIDGVTVLCVGLLCVRKGTHLLLNAWSKAKIKGRLVLVGAVTPEIATGCAEQLSRPDVVHIPQCNDVGSVYRSADLFAFPTLEEGSPLVSYEALGAGLPSIMSPMGAGEIIRHGRDGVIIDAYDEEAWIAALRQLAADRELRNEMGGNARVRAQDYTWQESGRRRRRQLQQVLAADSAATPCTAGVLEASV